MAGQGTLKREHFVAKSPFVCASGRRLRGRPEDLGLIVELQPKLSQIPEGSKKPQPNLSNQDLPNLILI